MVVPELRFSHPFQYNCLRLNQLTVTPLRYVRAYGSAEFLVHVGLHTVADSARSPAQYREQGDVSPPSRRERAVWSY